MRMDTLTCTWPVALRFLPIAQGKTYPFRSPLGFGRSELRLVLRCRIALAGGAKGWERWCDAACQPGGALEGTSEFDALLLGKS